MPYETRAQLVARLAKVDTALDKARTADSYNISDFGLKRNIKALQEERKEIISQIDAIDSASTGGIFNKVKFERPT